jgi:hypothetical protein
MNTEKLDLKFAGVDAFGRRLYKPIDRENPLIMVDNVLYTRTSKGEPNNIISGKYKIEFVKEKPHYLRRNFEDTKITLEYMGDEYETTLTCTDRSDYTCKGTFCFLWAEWNFHSYMVCDPTHGTTLITEIEKIRELI